MGNSRCIIAERDKNRRVLGMDWHTRRQQQSKRLSDQTVHKSERYLRYLLQPRIFIVFLILVFASAAYAIMRCPSVCVSVTLSRSYILSKRINIVTPPTAKRRLSVVRCV